MATLEELAAAMLGAQSQQAIAAENPYYSLTAGPDAFTNLATQAAATGKYGWKEVLPVVLGSGLLSGTLRGVGDTYQNALTDRYTSALANAISGKPTNIEGLSPSLTRQAGTAGGLFRLQRDLEDRSLFQKAAIERSRSIEDKLLERGFMVGEDGTLVPVAGLNPNTEAAAKAAAETVAKLQAEKDYFKLGQSAEQATEQDPRSPGFKAKRDIEDKIYSRITGSDLAKQFADIDANFKSLIALAREDSPAASVGMISALARIWDPQGTVREGEYHLNAQAQSALDNAIGNWRQVIAGKGRLSPDAKRSLISAASQKHAEFGKAYQTSRDAMLEALKAQGGTPAYIPVPEYSPIDLKTIDLGPMANGASGAWGELPTGLPQEIGGKKVMRVTKVK